MTLAVRNLAAVLAATIVLVLSMSGSAVAEPGFSFDATPGKLPKTVISVH
jgi:aminopeptidase N